MLIASMGLPERKRLYEFVKQFFDISAALALLVFTLPLWAVIAVLIRLDSKGPALFQQMRVGLQRQDSSNSTSSVPCMWKRLNMAFIPRIPTIPGSRASVAGSVAPVSMSCHSSSMFSKAICRWSVRVRRCRLSLSATTTIIGNGWQVIPGLTGLWQLSADRSFLIHENIQYDLYYIRHRNFFMDLAILLHTAVFAMKGI